MILVALFGGVVACSRRPRLEEVVLIDKPFIIGPEWIAITLAQPVTAKWKVQSVRLAMMDGSDAYLINFPKDVPEIELVSDDGALHPLEMPALHGSEILRESMNISLGSRFVKLRMRSSKSLLVVKVTWWSYMPEDFKGGVA